MGRKVMDSMVMRVLLYFIDNPSEELTTADMNAKFGARRNSLLQVLRPLIQAHLLTRKGGRYTQAVYAAGPRLLVRGGDEPWVAPVAAAPRRAARVACTQPQH